ncbi:MAG: DUF5675 family protein [Nitrospiraceae bacterium]
MSDLTLLRIASDAIETQGVLVAGGRAFAVTLELPWKDNAPEESCIPAGTYTCVRTISPHFGETFEIADVPKRSHILFHKGNAPADTKGCVVVAEKYTGQQVGESAEGFAELMGKFNGRDSFILSILDVNKYLPTA